QTAWRGVTYRSRTEARWAVALTLSGIEFDYEPETFRLPSGVYLPDFWLPKRASYLEIKPTTPTSWEVAKATDLQTLRGCTVYFGIGAPAPSDDWQMLTSYEDDQPYEGRMEELTAKARDAARNERFGAYDAPPVPLPERETPSGFKRRP